MEEDYFLYYEEVDWAFRRGDLPLVYCEDGLVHHRAGTAIGSRKIVPGSPRRFSMYFKYRGPHVRFMRRFNPDRAFPTAYGFALCQTGPGQRFRWPPSRRPGRKLRATLVGLRPPKAVSARLSRAALAAKLSAPVSRAKPASA